MRAGGVDENAELVLVAIGVAPASELGVQAGAKLGPNGALLVDESYSIGVPHVYAIGDCAAVTSVLTNDPLHLPLGSLANRQGRTLADRLAGRSPRGGRTAAAVAVKVFDLNVAAVGLSLARAKQAGLDARAVWLVADDTAHYWPEAKNIYLQLIYETGTRRVLGLQSLSEGDAAGRVNMAAQVILAGGTLEDLGEIEHAYAPPYSPAIDPLATVAFVAESQEEGLEARSPLEPLAGEALLDVRLDTERTKRPLDGEDVVVLGVEAAQAGELPEDDAKRVVICERGTRGSEVARLLAAKGRAVCYLGGGLSWQRAMGRS